MLSSTTGAGVGEGAGVGMGVGGGDGVVGAGVAPALVGEGVVGALVGEGVVGALVGEGVVGDGVRRDGGIMVGGQVQSSVWVGGWVVGGSGGRGGGGREEDEEEEGGEASIPPPPGTTRYVPVPLVLQSSSSSQPPAQLSHGVGGGVGGRVGLRVARLVGAGVLGLKSCASALGRTAAASMSTARHRPGPDPKARMVEICLCGMWVWGERKDRRRMGGKGSLGVKAREPTQGARGKGMRRAARAASSCAEWIHTGGWWSMRKQANENEGEGGHPGYLRAHRTLGGGGEKGKARCGEQSDRREAVYVIEGGNGPLVGRRVAPPGAGWT